VDPLHVYFDSNESDALNAQRLMNEGKAPSVAVGMSGESGFPHAGRLDFVDNQMNPDTGTLRYRAVLPNPNGIFKPGQFARVEMPVARLEQAILISRKAVLTDQDRRYVYVVGEDNTTARRAVKTGRELDDLVVVREGLEPGDRVIVNGTQKVFMPGMPVQPNTVSLDEPAGGDLAGQP